MANFLELTKWLKQVQLKHLAIPLYNKGGISNIEALRTAARDNALDFIEERDRVMLQQALQVQVRPHENQLVDNHRRPDAPTNKPKLRGNLQKALDAARPENREAARARLMKDIYAQSNLGSRESNYENSVPQAVILQPIKEVRHQLRKRFYSLNHFKLCKSALDVQPLDLFELFEAQEILDKLEHNVRELKEV